MNMDFPQFDLKIKTYQNSDVASSSHGTLTLTESQTSDFTGCIPTDKLHGRVFFKTLKASGPIELSQWCGQIRQSLQFSTDL